MKKIIALTLLILPLGLSAQDWEVGFFSGISHYNGDLTEGIIMPSTISPSIGGIIRYNLKPKWTIRGTVIYGTLMGDDAYATDERRRKRNLSFFSPVTEISIVPEFNMTGYRIRSKDMKLSPFAYAGLAIFKFNPMAERSNGQVVALQPLATEGQGSLVYQEANNFTDVRRRYALTQVSIPLGVGLKYAIGWNINISFEISARKTFTDYLDDVSKTYVQPSVFDQTTGAIGHEMSDRRLELTGTTLDDIPAGELYGPRGNSATQDWYYFHGFTLTYTFFPPRCFKF